MERAAADEKEQAKGTGAETGTGKGVVIPPPAKGRIIPALFPIDRGEPPAEGVPLSPVPEGVPSPHVCH